MGKKIKRSLFSFGTVLLVAALVFSGWQLVSIFLAYQKETAVKEEMQAFKPLPASGSTAISQHQGILDAKAMNPDVVGWIEIPGTAIDYAFVQTKNNSDYLRKDLHGDYALAGTLFLDYRNAPDFTDPKTILYGHNMQNGSMFGDLERYRDTSFMQDHAEGTVYLENTRYTFTVFACMEAEPDDETLYTLPMAAASRDTTLAQFEKTALAWQELTWNENDRLLLLSTCADDAGTTRLVVAARLATAS